MSGVRPDSWRHRCLTLTPLNTGHYEVWRLQTRRRDLSLSNLTFRRVDGKPVGVFNDWDLPVDASLPSIHAEQALTGILPFLAIDLLKEEGIGGKVAHLYRHDHESLTWILTWVCYCYTDGNYDPGNPLSLWGTDYQTCSDKKMAFLGNPLSMLASLRPWAQPWRLLLEARLVLLQEQYLVFLHTQPPPNRDEPAAAWAAYWDGMKSWLERKPDDPILRHVVTTYMPDFQLPPA